MARTPKKTAEPKTAPTPRTVTTTAPNTAASSNAPARDKAAAPKPKVFPSHEQIRQRAFEIFQRRNGGPGDAHGDWAQAERELLDELNR